MLPNCVADPTFVFEESEFVVEEMAEPTEEATPILTRICWCLIHLRLTSERGKKLCPKEEEKVLPYDDAEGLLLSLWLPPQHLLLNSKKGSMEMMIITLYPLVSQGLSSLRKRLLL